MNTQFTGVIINGGIAFDMPMTLPENTRVVVTPAEPQSKDDDSQTAKQQEQTPATTTREQRIAAMREFIDLATKNARPLSGFHYTREELYDRD